VICVTSLVMALAQDHLDAFAVCYTKAVDRLNRVSSMNYMLRIHFNSAMLADHRTRILCHLLLL